MSKNTYNNNSGWNTGDEIKCAKDCSWSDDYEGGKIYISEDVHKVIKALCQKIKLEWQMLLTGHIDDKGVHCTGYYIPKQEITAATVKNLDCVNTAFIQEHNVVCGIHSHANMGVFFSPTDEEFTNLSLITNHIVTNNDGKFKAVRRFDLPCGLKKFFEADVILETHEVEVEINGFENIEEKKYEPVGYGRGMQNGGYALGGGGWYNGDDYPSHINGAEPQPLYYGKYGRNNKKKRKKKKNKKSKGESTLHLG